MIVPFRLAVRPTPAAVDAFLLRQAVPVAGAAVFRVRGGLLVVPADPVAVRLPGAIRLRRLRGDLFVPFDADLVPALLPDEQTALTAKAGLVVLTSGEALSFDPNAPVPAVELFALPPVRRGEWQSFPVRPSRPDRLTRIEHPAPPIVQIEDVVGRAPPPPKDGAPVPEEARPPASGAVEQAVGRGKLAAAQAIALLGKLLGIPGLVKRGADIARRAAEKVPRLTESLLGAQEAALREVLRQLQAGDIENALKRAPIAVADPDAPTAVDHSASLSTRDPRYSLSALVTGGGLAGGWLGGGDVWASLAAEYRRLAAEAVRRGDYRRAAYLYGVLLRDPRSAATALSQGGLHRDAAVIFRDRVKDLATAAREFDKAGDVDEAVRLYLLVDRPESAGDVLARIGETDRANDFYRRAAVAQAERGRFLAAGDLVRTKAADPAAAARFYQAGWVSVHSEQVTCGERLLDHRLVTEDWVAVRSQFDFAEDAFAPPRTADAGRFFAYAMLVGNDFLPAELRDDLADRTRLFFAAHIRTAVRPDRVAGELFGPGGGWPGPVARDAAYAANPPKASPAGPVGHPPSVRLIDGTVTAVAVGWGEYDVVVGGTAGVVVWRPATGKVEPVCPTGGRTVVGLSTDFAARRVFVLVEDGEKLKLEGYESRNGRFEFTARFEWGRSAEEGVYLQPAAMLRAGEVSVTVVCGTFRLEHRGMNLWQQDVDDGLFPRDGYATKLLADGGGGYAWDWSRDMLRCLDPHRKVVAEWRVPWTPGVPAGSSLAVPPLDWTGQRSRQLEVVGVDRDGVLHWNRWEIGASETMPRVASAGLADPDRFFAACVAAGGRVAAVTGRNEVVWLRATDAKLERLASVRVQVPARAVAVVARPDAKEVAVVLDDGSAVRLPDPT